MMTADSAGARPRPH